MLCTPLLVVGRGRRGDVACPQEYAHDAKRGRGRGRLCSALTHFRPPLSDE